MLVFDKNKFFTVIKGAAFVIAINLSIAYFRSFFPISVENTNVINKNIEHNFIRLVLPLLLSPVLEELIFRKYIPYMFEDVLGRNKIIFLSNIIFSFVHLDIFFFPYFINGLIYSWFYETTKDIKVPIFIHINYNTFIFVMTYL